MLLLPLLVQVLVLGTTALLGGITHLFQFQVTVLWHC